MSIAALSNRWLTARAKIEELKEEMIAIEGELLGQVESTECGSKTTKAEGYKVTVKRPINRTIDGEAWEHVKNDIPADLWPIRVKVEPDARGCEWLAKNSPELWAIAAQAITEKAGKPGFTIERMGEE